MNSNSVSFPTRKNEKRKWKFDFVFSPQRKTKNGNKFWVSFSYAIENRLELRYTDHCSFIVLVLGSSSMYSPNQCEPRLKLFLRLDIICDIIHMCLILLLVYMKNRIIFTGKSEALHSWLAICFFLVVLSLFGLVTTQILICENQIIWSLEIPLRTIVAALIKIKCNGRFQDIKKRAFNR